MNRTALHTALHMTIAAGLLVATAAPGFAQEGRPAPRTAKDVAPIDLTGYWESRIVDEWRFRVTPQKGDLAWVQITADARKAAMAWDPAKDEAEGKACRAYGAVGITQRPGLMHITWSDPATLKMDFDTGTQTRMVHFSKAPADKGAASWQGYSEAVWQTPGNVLIFTGDAYVPALVRGQAAGAPTTGTLRVTTTNMLPGYIRKNGIPYSDKAVLTEYFNRIVEHGDNYLVMTQMVDDPANLPQPFIRTYTWKQLPNATGWDPTPCLPR